MPTSISESAAVSGGAAPGTTREALIRVQARTSGFDVVGITGPAQSGEAGAALKQFLARGWHGDMDWLAANAERRADPRAVWPEVRGIIMVGMNYGPNDDPLALLDARGRATISVYAQGRDYHQVVKKRLKTLGRWIATTFATEVKVFVDTAPVMEKPLAAEAGLGWQGKHTNIVSRTHGSWLFLGAVFTALDLETGPAETDHCGTCRACLDVCPTDAFPAPYQLDARRCISYLTIEHKGHIPLEFREPMGNRVYGCDDCLAVCPWNKYARAAHANVFEPRGELVGARLVELARLDDAAFRRLFAGTAIKRTGRDRFVRNTVIALGNSRDGAALPVVEERLDDPSPLVRAMAVWALRRLADAETLVRQRALRLASEADPAVRAEWGA